MITEAVKTKYSNGVLELPSNINLHEGQEVIIRFEFKRSEDQIWLDTIAENLADRLSRIESDVDEETRTWLSANLSGALPPYKWGKKGIPNFQPIRYEYGKGFVVIKE